MVNPETKEKVDKLYPAIASAASSLFPRENARSSNLRSQAEKESWPISSHVNDRLSKYGGENARDLLGYGPSSAVKWPKGAKVALNFVINYEEGAELCTLHGDDVNDGKRFVTVETVYDYGPRTGFWRLHRLFTSRKTPVTVFAVGMALERNPAVCHALRDLHDWEVASHGYRLVDYQNVDEETEREHIKRSIHIHERLIGKRPVGFYQGLPSENTRRLLVEEGVFKYDSDSYADDLPYWRMENEGKLHLIIPYTLTENDSRANDPNGDFFVRDLKDTLRYMVEEGRAGHCRMMSVGLHCRLARPGRVAALAEFLDFARSYGRDVWICTREEIADFWTENHSPKGAGTKLESEFQGELLVGFKRPEERNVTVTEDGFLKEAESDGDII